MSDSGMLSRREMINGRLLRGLFRAAGAVVAGRLENVLSADETPKACESERRHEVDETPPPGAERPQMKLPELTQSFLDGETLANLFRDIELCTKVIEVIPKYGAQDYAPETGVSLEEGRRLLMAGRLRGLQIRYHYEGAQWWDTLISTPSGVRVVRIRHDESGPGVAGA